MQSWLQFSNSVNIFFVAFFAFQLNFCNQMPTKFKIINFVLSNSTSNENEAPHKSNTRTHTLAIYLQLQWQCIAFALIFNDTLTRHNWTEILASRIENSFRLSFFLHFLSLQSACFAVLNFSSLEFFSYFFVFQFCCWNRSFRYRHGYVIFMNLLSLKARTIYSLRPYSLTFNARMRHIRSHWFQVESHVRASGARMCEWKSERVSGNAFVLVCWAAKRIQTHVCSHAHTVYWWRWRQQHWQYQISGAAAVLGSGSGNSNGDCVVNDGAASCSEECTFVYGLCACININTDRG